MRFINVKCPCCNKDIEVELRDDGTYSVVFFNVEISDKELLEKHGICLGVKGGE